ncbi:MAG TPA: prohibitin family protein [Rhizomicrobium sp.]|jgi:regulator of protease activity HflC (stomatin/prohibitin superfamily)|nr:prohibitin family protein [Rhizomicrobium sp.]
MVNTSYALPRAGATHIALLGAAIVGGLVFFAVALGSFYTVAQGERGVVTHYGAVVGEAEPGLGFKIPFVTGIHNISIQPQVLSYGAGTGSAPLEAYSKDQQPAKIQVSVNFHVTDPLVLYGSFGSIEQAADTILTPKVYEQLKNVFGQFDAVDSIQKRAVLNGEFARALTGAVKGPIVIDSVQIQDISFSAQYEKAVEDRMEAQVREQQAIAEKTQRMTRADAAKYEIEAQADAAAYAGKAEASAIQAKGEALRNNPEIVALTAAQKWNGALPTTMVPGGTLPFLDLKK